MNTNQKSLPALILPDDIKIDFIRIEKEIESSKDENQQSAPLSLLCKYNEIENIDLSDEIKFFGRVNEEGKIEEIKVSEDENKRLVNQYLEKLKSRNNVE